MNARRLFGLLLGAVFAVTVAAKPLCAQPLQRKDCCGPTCPAPETQDPPSCCQLMPAQAPAFTAAVPASPMLFVAVLGAGEALDLTPAVHSFSAGSDRSPPEPELLAPSGLSPPSLA